MARRLPPGVAALCTVQFVDVLGGTVVITALPTMLADLGAPQSASSLVVTGYAMFFGGLLVLGARCGDRFGHRRVLQIGIVAFALASLLAAVAPSIAVLVVARCLQGAAAAGSVPAALRLITAVALAGGARRRSLALWSASGAAAGASGFVLGGVVTQWASWRAVFWGMLVLGVVLLLVVRRAVPTGAGDPTQRLDVLGAVAITGSVMALVVGAALLEFALLPGGVLVVVGAVLVPVLVSIERRQRVPLLPGAAVRDVNLRAGAVGSFLNTATTSSAATLVTLHLQGVDRLSSLTSGLLLLPFSLAVVAGAPLSARLLRRSGPRSVIALGLGLIAVANVALLPFAVVTAPFSMALAGLGIGLSSVAATTIGTDVPSGLQGVASGVLNTAAQLGTALGVAAILLVASLSGSGSPAAGARAGWTCIALLAASGACAFTLRRRSPVSA